jgi:predicted kinase
LAERQQSGAGPSDADWSVHLEQRRRFEPIRADEGNDHLLLDTAVPLPEIASAVEQALRLRLERKQVLTP